MSLPHLTIAYMTCRKEPMVEWFFDSLHRECGGDYSGFRIVVVDLHANSMDRSAYIDYQARDRVPIIHTSPCPGVWQGPHRLTKRDYFAASNARNTALCLSPDGWIAYVDDLSVLMPGWLACVREAMEKNYIALGAYRKVLNLSVDETGHATYDTGPGLDDRSPMGMDSRWKIGNPTRAVPCSGNILYGCSNAMPVESLLRINGWNSDCDGLGFEDIITGIALEKAGYKFRYDIRMMTLESEERHHDGSTLPRVGKGVDPHTKGHAILDRARNGTPHPNYWGEGGIRAVRERVLRGEPFPIIQCPTCDWYDGQPLSEL